MSNLDLYDDLFPDDASKGVSGSTYEDEIDADFYEKDTQVLETEPVSQTVEKLKASNDKLQKEIETVRNENNNWKIVYHDMTRKLEISKRNVSALLLTARNEIKRKNELNFHYSLFVQKHS